MSITKRTLLGSGATLALASTVRAQAPGPYQGSEETQDVILDHLFDNQGLHIDQNGRVTRLKMGTNGMAAVRPHGHEMPTGHAMVYRENGRTYMCSNDKMNDGTMLFDHTRDWRS
jgi:hypothetical protein